MVHTVAHTSSTEVEIDIIVIVIQILIHVFIASYIMVVRCPGLVISAGVDGLRFRDGWGCGLGGRRGLGSIVVLVTVGARRQQIV